MTKSARPAIGDGPIAHLHHWARNTPSNPALVGPNLSLSWAELLEQVQKLSQWLRGQELTGGVLIDATDEFEKIYSLACVHEGIFFAGLPSRHEHQKLKDLGFTTVLTLKADFESELLNVLVFENKTSRQLEAVKQGLQPKPLLGGSLARVVFSSGTTGLPKPTPFSFDLQAARVFSAGQHYMKQNPFFTMVGFRTTAGSTCFFLDLWRGSVNLTPGSPKKNLRMIRAHGVKGVMASPTALDALRAAHVAGDSQAISKSFSLEEIVSAGSFVHPKMAKAISEAFDAKVTNVYGSTEAGLISFSDATTDPNDLTILYPDVEITILKETGEKAAVGEPGKILLRTPYMRIDYLENSTFSPIDQSELFEPGDLGFLTEAGQLKVLGREDDLINLSGIKIDPRPIEDYVLANFQVDEAVSMLATNQDGKTFHVMFVVSNDQLNPLDLKDRIHLVFGNKSPQLVIQTDAIAKNQMGKVSRRVQIQTGS